MAYFYTAVHTLYVDLEKNLTDAFLITGAARFEDYSDSGNKLTAKATARYDLSDFFALRGSISTGFRAPSLQQSALTNDTVNVDGSGNLVSTLIAASGTPITSALGIDQLDLESSTNIGAGFVVNLASGLKATVDFYQIDIDDRIVLGGGVNEAILRAAGQDAAADALVSSGASSAQFFSNGADTRTRGVDAVITYNTEFAGGDLGFALSGNLNDTDVTSINSANGISESLTLSPIDVDFIENGQPGERVTFTSDFEKGKWGGLVRFNYFGETELDFFAQNHIPIPGTQLTSVVEGKLLTDLEVSYQMTDAFKVSVGGNNVFDATPDELESDDVLDIITGGAARFPVRGVPYGFNGGSYYVRLSANF